MCLYSLTYLVSVATLISNIDIVSISYRKPKSDSKASLAGTQSLRSPAGRRLWLTDNGVPGHSNYAYTSTYPRATTRCTSNCYGHVFAESKCFFPMPISEGENYSRSQTIWFPGNFRPEILVLSCYDSHVTIFSPWNSAAL